MSPAEWLRRHKDRLVEQSRDLTAPGARRAAWVYLMVYDHGFLRSFWRNFEELAPGVYRANQPSPARLAQYAQRGITTIINLRGPSGMPPHQFEVEACAALGLELIDVPYLSARHAPEKKVLLTLVETLRTAQAPFLMHCKSGADRTSLAAAIYELVCTNASVAKARRHFSIRFIHFKWTTAGVMDHIIDRYEAACKERHLPFEDWVRDAYDDAEIQADFEASRRPARA